MFEDLFGDILEKELGKEDPTEGKEGNTGVDTWDTGKEQSFWKDTPTTLWKN